MKVIKAAKKNVAQARLLKSFKDPSPLPSRNRAEFDEWIKSIFDAYDLPSSSNYIQAVAAAIMHLPATQHEAPKAYFEAVIRKAMANQIAYEIIDEIRQADKAKAEAELEAKKLALVTAEPAAVEPK